MQDGAQQVGKEEQQDEVDLSPEEQLTRHRVAWERAGAPKEGGVVAVGRRGGGGEEEEEEGFGGGERVAARAFAAHWMLAPCLSRRCASARRYVSGADVTY